MTEVIPGRRGAVQIVSRWAVQAARQRHRSYHDGRRGQGTEVCRSLFAFRERQGSLWLRPDILVLSGQPRLTLGGEAVLLQPTLGLVRNRHFQHAR